MEQYKQDCEQFVCVVVRFRCCGSCDELYDCETDFVKRNMKRNAVKCNSSLKSFKQAVAVRTRGAVLSRGLHTWI